MFVWICVTDFSTDRRSEVCNVYICCWYRATDWPTRYGMAPSGSNVSLMISNIIMAVAPAQYICRLSSSWNDWTGRQAGSQSVVAGVGGVMGGWWGDWGDPGSAINSRAAPPLEIQHTTSAGTKRGAEDSYNNSIIYKHCNICNISLRGGVYINISMFIFIIKALQSYTI